MGMMGGQKKAKSERCVNREGGGGGIAAQRWTMEIRKKLAKESQELYNNGNNNKWERE